jgi:hypothetical protein
MTDDKQLVRRKARDRRYKKGVWTTNQKIQVVSTYLMLGSLTQTAVVTGVPYQTVERWKTMDWWKEYALKLQTEDIQKLDGNLKKIVEKALRAVEDRLDNGEAQYDQKTGEIVRIPVKAHVALKISTELLTKQDKIRSQPEIKEIEATIDARLTKLAEEFSKFTVQQNNRTVDVEMVEVVNPA